MNLSIIYALAAAALFGASTPLAKSLGLGLSPILLAGLLYLGSGIGLAGVRLIRDRGWKPTGLTPSEWPWLLGAIAFGGLLGPATFACVAFSAACALRTRARSSSSSCSEDAPSRASVSDRAARR